MLRKSKYQNRQEFMNNPNQQVAKQEIKSEYLMQESFVQNLIF